MSDTQERCTGTYVVDFHSTAINLYIFKNCNVVFYKLRVNGVHLCGVNV